MTSCARKGFAFSPEKDQCTACGRVIVAGPMGLSRHLVASHTCSKYYEEAQFNPRCQQVLFPSMQTCSTVGQVDDGRQSGADFMHRLSASQGGGFYTDIFFVR